MRSGWTHPMQGFLAEGGLEGRAAVPPVWGFGGRRAPKPRFCQIQIPTKCDSYSSQREAMYDLPCGNPNSSKEWF